MKQFSLFTGVRFYAPNVSSKYQPTSESVSAAARSGTIFTAAILKPIVCSIFLFCCICSTVQAQPVITKNIGMPSGNANSRGVAYGNGIYVTILSTGYIYQSTDGNDWSKVTDAGIPAGTFSAISFGNGVFVVCGYNGLILTSPNGINWTVRTSTTAQTLYDVKYLASAFYATGNNRTLIKSTDGITWATQTITGGPATDYLLSITYGGGMLVISSRPLAGGGYVYKSATGASGTWTYQNLNAGLLNRVQHLNDRFFAFFAGNQVYTSTDANTWTNSTASITLTLPDASPGVWNSSNQIFNGFYDGTKYYFFGSSQYYSGYGSVWTATTGLNLTLLTKTAYIVPQGSAFLNGKYFITGNEGIVSSNDGITFKYPTGNYYSVASSGTSYVGVGMIGSNNGSLFTSPDFNTWTEKTPLNQKELYGVAYDGSKYLAVGQNSVIESTDNGNTWLQIATPTDVKTYLAWGNNKFVSVGYDNVSYIAQIASSATGSSWTTVNTEDNYYFKVKYVNGKFFAMGYDNINYNGIIMYSADGTTWTNITPNLPYSVYYFNDVVWDGTKYHFMGVETDFFSVSTATVTDPNSFSNKGTIASPPPGSSLGGDWGNGAFVYTNGRFAGVVNDINNGYNAYVIYSNDGINWSAESIDETTSIQGAITEGNTVRFLGTGDGKISLAFGVLAVSFLDINAMLVNSESVITWKTATEQNSKDFVLQYSINGINWSDIGIVIAAGNSSSVQHYSFSHKTPVMGINSYRVVERDINGKTIVSKIVNVRLKANDKQMLIYPNPVRNNKVTLELPNAATVTLYNNNGMLVLHKQLAAGTQQLDISGFAKGIYTVNAGGESIKLLIQ